MSAILPTNCDELNECSIFDTIKWRYEYEKQENMNFVCSWNWANVMKYCSYTLCRDGLNAFLDDIFYAEHLPTGEWLVPERFSI